MSIINILQIYLITYNRKKQLQRTLNQILAENSPIQNFDITILDNASTDGSSELIDEYCQKFSNLKHIRHHVNIGGNANICRAFELGAGCGKEYVWVLCDDDFFDFTNWEEVEKRIYACDDIICVSDYIFPHQQARKLLEYQMLQLSFVPASIIKTSNITNDVLMNMYDCIIFSFPQLVLAAQCINERKSIYIISRAIITVGYLIYDDKIQAEDISYTRGMQSQWCIDRRKKAKWVSNFVQILSLLDDKKLQAKTLEVSLNSNIEEHWNYHLSLFLNCADFNYFYEIFKKLKFKRKMQVLLSRVIYTYNTKKDIRLYFFGLKLKIFPRMNHNAMGGGGSTIQSKK